MDNPAFQQAIRRLRWQHWLHYPVQGLVMAGVVLLAGPRTAVGPTLEPRLATWPVLLLLVALLLLAGLVLAAFYRRMQPNLRRSPQGNMRFYQARIFLRNSLLALVPLPLLGSYVLTHQPFDLAIAGAMLVALGWRLAPTAATYQRWLLG